MKDAPQRLVYLDAFQNELPPDRGKIVFLSQILPTPNTLGYENLEHLVVKVNGCSLRVSTISPRRRNRPRTATSRSSSMRILPSSTWMPPIMRRAGPS